MTPTVSFCTLFDSAYLPQGLALYKSLCRHSPDFILWIMPMDQKCYDFLEKQAFSRVRLVHLSNVENTKTLAVKASRSHGEYCWTLTPFLINRVLELDTHAPFVTYIDADCWLVDSVSPLINAFLDSKADCMITPHAYPEGSTLAKTAGTYCVQFMPFKPTAQSFEMLSLWSDRCLQSCSNSLDGSGLGDQIHLEDWPQLFGPSVFVLDNPALTLAPWNIEHLWARSYSPLCLYHFQGFRLFHLGNLLIFRASAQVQLPSQAKERLLIPYIADVLESLSVIPERFQSLRPLPLPWVDLRGYFLFFPRLILRHWVIRLSLKL